LHEHTGVFFRDIEEIELYRVKDISVQKPWLQALFGQGRIKLISTDRTSPQVLIDAVSQPTKVAALIRECVEQCRVAKGVRDISM
jgi:Bacterial PH domain